MRQLAHLSIKSRLILMLLVVSLLSLVLVGYLGWSNGRQALHRAIVNQLTNVRASKAYQVEMYFDRVFDHTATLSEDLMVVEAMQSFGDAYRDVSTWPIVPEWETALDRHYTEEFLPQLEANVTGTPPLQVYRPDTTAATYLQYHYIATNPFPSGSRDFLSISDSDTSPYNLLHERLHPIFRDIVTRFGYQDLYLIDIRTGEIVYTVYKQPDFGTNILEGPYRESNFAELVRTIQRAPDRGAVRIIDFRPYRPAYAAPSAFVGAPIYDGAEAIGVLALQLPVDEINNVMTGGQNWRADGLGDSGESYLVGPDLLMRSVSRYLIEDQAGYLAALRAAGVPQETVARIEQFNTSILLQPVNTASTQKVLRNQQGTEIVTGYRGTPTLSSYAPLSIEGLDWGILSEMSEAEAFAPVARLQRNILISSVILVLLITFAALALSRLFVRPIEKLIAGVRRVGGGDHNVVIDLHTDDEFGDLAHAFNDMVASIREQTALIEQKNAENERLLLNVLPAPIAARLRAGEQVVDTMQQVSVIFIHILGFTEMSQHQNALESAASLEEIINTLDELAEQYEIERVKTIGETYVAACGLTIPCLDHTKRTIDFAIQAINTILSFDLEHHEQLSMQISVNAGPVIAGIVGAKKFRYELWGETVNVARRIRQAAEPNTVLVTQAAYERVRPFYTFERHRPVTDDEGNEITVWRLAMDKGRAVRPATAPEDATEDSGVAAADEPVRPVSRMQADDEPDGVPVQGQGKEAR